MGEEEERVVLFAVDKVEGEHVAELAQQLDDGGEIAEDLAVVLEHVDLEGRGVRVICRFFAVLSQQAGDVLRRGVLSPVREQ